MDEFDAISETAGAAAVEIAVASMLERGGKVVPCNNCAAPVFGAYCSACGQPTNTHRRSVVRLLHDVVKDIASFDSRILRTASALLFRPGELPLAFREGRTQPYVPPVRLYLFVTLIFFFALAATHIAILQMVPTAMQEKIVNENGHIYAVVPGEAKVELPRRLFDDHHPHYSISANKMLFFQREGAYRANISAAALKDLESRMAEEAAASGNSTGKWIAYNARRTVDALAKDPAALNGALTAWIPRALFLLLPLFALLLALFYRRQRRSFYLVDHLVFSLSFHTFGFVLLLAAAAMAQAMRGGTIAWLMMVALGVYLLLGMKRFYAQNWFWTGTKFVAVCLIYSVFFVFPALVAIFIASMLYG